MHGLCNGSALLGANIFGLAITLAVVSRRRERHIIAAKLPGLMAHGLVTPTEATWLSSLKSRKMAVNSARHFGGRRAVWSVKRFTMAVVELACVSVRRRADFAGLRRTLAAGAAAGATLRTRSGRIQLAFR